MSSSDENIYSLVFFIMMKEIPNYLLSSSNGTNTPASILLVGPAAISLVGPAAVCLMDNNHLMRIYILWYLSSSDGRIQLSIIFIRWKYILFGIDSIRWKYTLFRIFSSNGINTKVSIIFIRWNNFLLSSSIRYFFHHWTYKP